MVAEQGRAYLIVGEQFSCVARVLSRNGADLAEHAQGAQGDVFQVPNRGGHQVECSHEVIVAEGGVVGGTAATLNDSQAWKGRADFDLDKRWEMS